MHRIYVHNYHLDGYGHVNNARYLEFLEEARWQFFQKHQLLLPLRQAQLVVSHMTLNYRTAATRDDVLLIDSHITAVASRQIQINQCIKIEHSQKTALTADVVLMPTENGKVVRLSESLFQQLTQFIQKENT